MPAGAKLVSFDVCSLFPSVPINRCKNVISDIIWRSCINPVIKKDLEDSMFMCMDQNYFRFNSQIYIQNDGLTMGSPLSPLLADIFMNNIEKLIFMDKNKCNNILYWYIDM